jgi:hypothetical protein
MVVAPARGVSTTPELVAGSAVPAGVAAMPLASVPVRAVEGMAARASRDDGGSEVALLVASVIDVIGRPAPPLG